MSFRDHHCIFINNCTGFNNIQYFVCFLFWGAYAIIFDMYAYLSFTYLQLSKTVRIISFIDFLGNAFFLCNIISILIRSLLAIYENRTFIEITKNPIIEDKCPFYDWHKESMPDAISWCIKMVEIALENKMDVVVCNTFTKKRYVKAYEDIAKKHGANFEVYRCVGNFKNVHNLPEKLVESFKQAMEDWPGEKIVETKT